MRQILSATSFGKFGYPTSFPKALMFGFSKYHPFWGPPFSIKHPPKKIAASKMQIDALQNTNWREETSVYLRRLILSWGCFIEKG